MEGRDRGVTFGEAGLLLPRGGGSGAWQLPAALCGLWVAQCHAVRCKYLFKLMSSWTSRLLPGKAGDALPRVAALSITALGGWLAPYHQLAALRCALGCSGLL